MKVENEERMITAVTAKDQGTETSFTDGHSETVPAELPNGLSYRMVYTSLQGYQSSVP